MNEQDLFKEDRYDIEPPSGVGKIIIIGSLAVAGTLLGARQGFQWGDELMPDATSLLGEVTEHSVEGVIACYIGLIGFVIGGRTGIWLADGGISRTLAIMDERRNHPL